MKNPLAGRSILIAEDEPLIAIEVFQTFEEAGAKVILARTLADALRGVEDPNLSAAVLDHGLGAGNSTEVCARLKNRGIPFVIYSGYDHLDEASGGAVHVKKPASTYTLVAAVQSLLAKRQVSN